MFDDLLDANRRYATSAPRNFDGYAHAGVAVVTCMDSRLQPLEMIGLMLGEAKILRTPGGHGGVSDVFVLRACRQRDGAAPRHLPAIVEAQDFWRCCRVWRGKFFQRELARKVQA